jgi:DNA-binding transcriptional regulator LsrR (DeoR family)
MRQLLGRGKTQRQISEIMKISLGKTNPIVQSLKKESKINIQKYVNEELPA